MAANALLYGSVGLLPVPDLWRTDFAILIGANPLVSRGSLISLPRFPDALDGIVERGGRVVVIDPRRTETAARYEHVPVRAGGDPHLLLGLLHTLVTEGLVDQGFLAAHTTGSDRLADLVAPFPPEAGERHCQVPAATVRELARAFAAAPSGVVYGRTGTCTQRFGTLNNLVQDLIMIRDGERRTGRRPPVRLGAHRLRRLRREGRFRHLRLQPHPGDGAPRRVRDAPVDLAGARHHDARPGQVRGLSRPGGEPRDDQRRGRPQLEAALEQLDLHFSLDLYVNDTNRHAHYVLPVPGMYERDDVPLPVLSLQLKPSIWATEAVIAPLGSVRPEWEILNDIARRVGAGGAYAIAPLRWLAKAGVAVKPAPSPTR